MILYINVFRIPLLTIYSTYNNKNTFYQQYGQPFSAVVLALVETQGLWRVFPHQRIFL